MATPVPFEGFRYDDGRALAMADAIAATFKQAAIFDVTAPDELAALGIAAARVIADSKLSQAPDLAVERLGRYILAYLTSRGGAG